MIQVFVLLAPLTAMLLQKMEKISPKLYVTAMALCVLVLIHNFPAMITRYVYMP